MKQVNKALGKVKGQKWVNTHKNKSVQEIVDAAFESATCIPPEIPVQDEIGTLPSALPPPPASSSPVPRPCSPPTTAPSSTPCPAPNQAPSPVPCHTPSPAPSAQSSTAPSLTPSGTPTATANTDPVQVPAQDRIGLMWPRGVANNHTAAPLLHDYSINGCPVNCGRPWTKDEIMAAIERGAHKSACVPEAREYLLEQTKQKVKDGFANLVRLRDIIDNLPTNLKISPVSMISHKSRTYRVIMDLSFALRYNGAHIPSVNETTELLAPQKAMAELGKVIRRIICFLAENYDPQRPFKFAKIDIKDGFWRMVVSPEDAWHFCYTIPPASEEEDIMDRLIVVPTSLQTGWRESPPYFCTATETARDVIQAFFNGDMSNLALHPVEAHMCVHPSGSLPEPTDKPAYTSSQDIQQDVQRFIEVYVDDFIAGTNDLSQPNLEQMSRAILHGVHSVFPPPHISGHSGEDPVSFGKLLKGEGYWDFHKEILGWDFNGRDYTIQLPPDKVTKLQDRLTEILTEKEAPYNEFEKVMGKINHASIGIPNGRGLSAPIYQAMKHNKTTVPINPPVKQALKDWKTIIQEVANRPTHVLELMPGDADYIGFVDACKTGVGGVWLSGNKKLSNPFVWHMEWPDDIRNNLVSASNPTGTITINDLEMAGVLLHWLVLEQLVPAYSLRHTHIAIYCDNKSTVHWTYKLNSRASIIAQHLLRALGLRQHHHRASPLTCASIAGTNNGMADVASRSFINPVFKNKPFLTTFASLFPLPQNAPWREFHLTKKLTSPVISCLRGRPLNMASWTKPQKRERSTGDIGSPTPKRFKSHHSSTTAIPSNKTSSSQPSLRGSGQATTVAELQSELRQSVPRWQPCPRPSNWLDNQARSTKQRAHTPNQWHGLWRDGADPTRLPRHN